MSWKKWLSSALLVGSVAGCQFPQTSERDNWKNEVIPPPNVRSTEAGKPTVQRGQTPDTPVRPASLLDTAPESNPGRLISSIRATVNGRVILESDVRTIAPPNASADELRKTLEKLIDRELVLFDCEQRFGTGPGAKFLEKLKEGADAEFDKQVLGRMKEQFKLKTNDELKNLLKSQGVTIDSLKAQWRKQFIFNQYLQFQVGPYVQKIGHVEIRDYYESHPEEFETADSVHWQDIFIAASAHPSRDAAKKAAVQVQTRMRQGEDIAKLMPSDNGDSVYRNGDGLGRKRGEIKPREAEEVLFRMKERDTAVVEIEGGYHVIRLVKREFAGRMPFDENVQNSILEKLKNEAFSREAKRFVNDLKRKASIEIAK
jgi:parvulin-like peptidyl-prolyl isomerase